MAKKIKLLFTCCFCGDKFDTEEANNAAPVIENGECCNECNKKYVIPARIELAMMGRN